MRTLVLTVVMVVGGGNGWAQTAQPVPPAHGAAAAPAATDAAEAAFKPEEMEQMLAPIALYPDPLLSQVLMASTYPLEIVQADRWVKARKDVKTDAAAKALEAEPWDPSVKSLVNFPDVLAMLSDKLEWTQKLGDAFLGQQQEVMDTVQRLRGKAKQAGNLQSSKEQTVEVEARGSTEVIVIEPAEPDVIYVPTYDTTVVYGGWPYPAYPPYPYYPPAYPHPTLYGFGMGVACGLAWGYAWGNCNWHGGDIDIDVDRNVNRNRNIDRSKHRRDTQARGGGASGRGSWRHNPSHRQGVPYRNQTDARRFGGTSASDAARARESYRGRADAGRRDIAAGGADRYRPQTTPGSSDRAAPNRSGADRSRAPSGGRESALSGADRSGREARSSSERGRSSMGSSSRSGSNRSAGSRSSGSRSQGGSRGGGGRGGGGRGGGRR